MMILGGFPVLGKSVSTPLKDKEMVETEERLIAERLQVVRTKAQKACQNGWMNRFMGSGSPIEHEAFLSMSCQGLFFLQSRIAPLKSMYHFSMAVVVNDDL